MYVTLIMTYSALKEKKINNFPENLYKLLILSLTDYILKCTSNKLILELIETYLLKTRGVQLSFINNFDSNLKERTVQNSRQSYDLLLYVCACLTLISKYNRGCACKQVKDRKTYFHT